MKRASHVIAVLVLLSVLLLMGTGAPSYSQAEQFPPVVIDIWPQPGVELLPTDPLTITFDQPMDRATVEAALMFEPALTGLFTWIDAQTVEFKPGGGWTREQIFAATVKTSAAAATGLKLEAPYRFKVQTLGPLAVARVSPASDTENVSLDAKIVVNFNRAVLALAADSAAKDNPVPLTFEPTIAGKGEWVNELLYVFTPTDLLRRNTHYTARLAALTGVDGAQMHQPFIWSFTTKPPELPRISVLEVDHAVAADLQNVPLHYGIRVSFAQSMDRASIEAAFSLTTQGRPVPGSFTWEADSTALAFKPRQLLALDTAYTVTVQKTAKMRDGSALSQDTQLAFHTQPYPRVVASTPRNGAIGVSTPATEFLINFNVLMNTLSIHNSLVIVPKPDSIQSNYERESERFWLSFRSKPNTTYTITLTAGAVDTYGNLLREDYTFSFTTEDSSPEPPPGHFRPRINGDLMITDAAQTNTQVMVDFSRSAQTVEVNLYRFPPGELGGKTLINDQFYRDYGYYEYNPLPKGTCKPPPIVNPANLIRAWQEIYDPDKDKEDVRAINLASPTGGKLAPGLYWVTMGSTIRCAINPGAPEKGTETGPQWQFGLAVVTANLTIKRGTEDIFVWLTDLEHTAPVPGAKVTVWADGKALASGITAADGTAKVPMRLQEHPMILITAEKPGTYAAWYNNWLAGAWRQFDGEGEYGDHLSEPNYEEDYIYTDRPIYRPGDTIYYRGVVRAKRDMAFPVSDKRTAYLKIEKFDSGDFAPLVNTTVALSAFGTFSGEYTIPADAPLTDLHITIQLEPDPANEETACSEYYYYDCNTVEHATVTVRVAAYRPAAFEVAVKPEQPVIVQGDTIDATIQGLYYFGGTVKNDKVTWQTYRRYASFHYSGPGRYTFDQQSYYTDYHSYYLDYYDYVYLLRSGDATVDAQGRATIHVETEKSDSAYPVRYIVEGTIQDETGTTVSGRVAVVAHPANLYIGISERPGIAKPHEVVPLDLITVTPDSQPKPYQQLTLTVKGFQWSRSAWGNWKTYQTKSLVTDGSGKAHASLDPLAPGYYLIQAEGQDEHGRTNDSRLDIWVPDPAGNMEYGWLDSYTNDLVVLTDRREYRPGDVAQLLIPVPFEGPSRVLLTTERAGVISHVVLEANGKPLVYSLPLSDADAPTTYIQAVYLECASASNPHPRFRVSVPLDIDVTPVKALLNVQVTPSKTQAKPGDSVTFDVRVTDSEGKPVVAEVGLKLVDKAVLALLTSNSITLQRAFYSPQGRYMYTDISLDGLLELLGEVKNFRSREMGGGGGGSDDQGMPDTRQNYKTTPLWAPHIVTDANGHAQVTVTLPDNLTTWELDARALTMDMKVGQATTEIMTSLPLIVQPVTPRFLVAGDHVQLAAIIHNQTGKDQTVEASLTAKGVRLNGQAAQSVVIPADSRVRVIWPVVVEEAAGADLIFQAVGDGVSDAAKPALTTGPGGTIPILHYVTPDVPVGTAGVLRAGGSTAVTVTLPPRLKASEGNLTVRVEPSLAATLTDSFTYLRQFPHYCIEQTVSRFLPNLVTYRALADLGQSDPALEAALKREMGEALTKLTKEQKPEGGWGWYPSMKIDPLTSAYAALGLIEAKSAGYTLNADMLNRAVAYVKGQSAQSLGASDWQLNRLAFYLYVLARAGQGDRSSFDELATLHTRLSYAGRAFLLMAYHERFSDAPQVNLLISDLLSGASYTPDGIYWDESSNDWWNWGTDTRTTALALTALIRAMPKSNLLPDVVRWLIAARTVDHWPTTQETVWSITALTEWMVLTGELKGQYTYNLSLNRQTLGKGVVTPETIRESTTVRVAVRDLLVTNRLIVARGEGTGALYYAAQLQLYSPANQAKALNRGIGVQREYFLDDRTVPITAARIGDAITVRLTITLSQDVYYFALEDHVPAGTEPIDTSLLTANLGEQNDARYERWYWGWWYFQQQELRDTGMHLYADYLPAGTYVFTYQVRAAVAGEFQVIPTQAYTFYASDIFGRTGGLLFKIE